MKKRDPDDEDEAPAAPSRRFKFLSRFRKKKGDEEDIKMALHPDLQGLAGGPSTTASGDESSQRRDSRRRTTAVDRGYTSKRSTKVKKQESSSYTRTQKRRA